MSKKHFPRKCRCPSLSICLSGRYRRPRYIRRIQEGKFDEAFEMGYGMEAS
jgi:hypothetical protein